MTSTDASFEMRRSEALASLLNVRLNWLSYLSFATVVCRVLERSGYSSVRLSNRKFLRGRTSEGGFDITASLQTPSGAVPVLVQVKRYTKTPVSRHFVDELRSAELRRSAFLGLIVTTGTVSPTARKAAAEFPGRAVFFVDGTELGRLMLAHRIGVAEHCDLARGTTSLNIDEEAFERLEAFAEEERRRKARR